MAMRCSPSLSGHGQTTEKKMTGSDIHRATDLQDVPQKLASEVGGHLAMPVEQVHSVLQHTLQHHTHAADYFADLAERCQGDRSKMLLTYMSTHERHLAQSIEVIMEDAEHKALNTWVQSTDGAANLAKAFSSEEDPAPDAAFDDLIDRGLQIDDVAIQLYEDLALRCEIPWLKESFENILQLERQEEKQMARQALRGMDL